VIKQRQRQRRTEDAEVMEWPAPKRDQAGGPGDDADELLQAIDEALEGG
jgi:hypothetical protein